MDVSGIFMMLLQLLGGLALFLFGIHLLSKGLEKYAGAQLQSMIEKLTNHPAKGAVVGTFITALLQSSSLLMVTMIGLINAGMMTFEQALGIILGMEIGTTFTAQLIAFDIGKYFFLPIILGFSMIFFSHRLKWKYIGQAVIGFGILFMGMSIMKLSMEPLSSSPAVIGILGNLGTNPLLAVVLGIIFTALIQSSSATMGLVIAMGMSNIITLPGAIGLVLGANIGTCITGFLASIGTSISSRRASIAQIIISTVGVLLFLPFIMPFANLIAMTSSYLPRQIANAHTLFNLIITLVFYPLIGLVARTTMKLIPGIDTTQMGKIDVPEGQSTPEAALRKAEEEIFRMGDVALDMIKVSRRAILKNDKKAMKEVFEKEIVVDRIYRGIEKFLNSIVGIEVTGEHTQEKVKIIHLKTDIERVADLAHNIARYAKEKKKKRIKFTSAEEKVLKSFFRRVTEVYQKSLKSIKTKNRVLARSVFLLEDEIDLLDIRYRKEHTHRLEKGDTTPRGGVLFLRIIRDLERIGDHADNIAATVVPHDRCMILLSD